MGVVKLLNWTITPWQMTGKGGWKGIAPVILIEGRPPFSAEHPQAYIDKLQEMHDDPILIRWTFFTFMGQFKDALEQHWEVEIANGENSVSRNGHRKGRQRNRA